MRMTNLLPILPLLAASVAQAAEIVVTAREIEDRKAIIATVEPVRQLVARTRIGGTIISLKVREGDVVAAGQEIAVIEDQKLVLQRQALDQRIKSQQAQRDQAEPTLIEFRISNAAASARRRNWIRRAPLSTSPNAISPRCKPTAAS